MNTRERFRRNLRCWRRIRGFTQEELSNRLDMSQSYIGSMEANGQFPSPETLDDICTILNVDVTDLLCEPVFNEVLAHLSIKQSKQIDWRTFLNNIY